MIESVKIDGENIERISYEGDFDEFLLENIHESDIQDYVEFNLDMIKEDDIELTCITDFSEDELLEALKERGWISVKAESIVEEDRIKEAIEAIK